MQCLIDSDLFIEFLWEDSEAARRIENLLPACVAISILTYMESFQGTFKRSDPVASQEQYAHFLTGIPVLDFTIQTAELCAQLRHQLSTEGRRVRNRVLDLMIAATALEHGLTLVTRNRADYQDVPGLTLA
jgi:predicted nucleic acid-binding protein